MDIYKCPFFSFAYQAFFRCKINNKINIVLKEYYREILSILAFSGIFYDNHLPIIIS